jgi:hypothetical protein
VPLLMLDVTDASAIRKVVERSFADLEVPHSKERPL